MALPNRPHRDPGRAPEIKHVEPDPRALRQRKLDEAAKVAAEQPAPPIALGAPLRTSTP